MRLVALTAALGLACSATLRAQDCAWIQRPSVGSTISNIDGLVFDAARSRLVLLAYVSGNPQRNETWEWDGLSPAWTLRVTNGLPPRIGYRAVYDSNRARTVLFGGYVPETWEWDGTAWTQVGSTGPSARGGYAMAYDSARARMMLFGGAVFNGPLLQDLWEWNGAAWSQVNATGPSARSSASMTYDIARSCLVLYGGHGTYPANYYLTDTWEWSSATGQWALRATTGPEPNSSSDPAAIYDTVRQRVTLHAGWATNDIWEWDGTWTLRSGGPSLYNGTAMAYDSARTRAVTVTPGLGPTWDFNPAALAFPPAFTQFPRGYPYANPGQTVTFHSDVMGTPAPALQWFRNSTALANSAIISGAQSDTLTINPVSGIDSGYYSITATNPCGTVSSPGVYLFVTEPPPLPCYPNCDNSTSSPMLTANDFQCFLGAYAAGMAYANCDASSNLPILNVNDFQCYLNRYAAGCS